jgi:hypothetical protein
MTDLALYASLSRLDADGYVIACDVRVFFDIARRRPGYPATRHDPGEADEYQCVFTGAEFDPQPDDAPGPLDTDELADLRAWFDRHHEQAALRAADAHVGM